MGMGVPERRGVENMDSYEREKIAATLRDAQHLVAVIENYLKTVDFCNEKGIDLSGRKSLNAIRGTGELADPAGTLTKLSILFESGMSDMAKQIDVSHKDELEKRYEA